MFCRVREGRPAEAKEFANGSAFAHYNNRGELPGIELLGPCEITVLDKIVGRDAAARKFVRNTVAPAMLATTTAALTRDWLSPRIRVSSTRLVFPFPETTP